MKMEIVVIGANAAGSIGVVNVVDREGVSYAMEEMGAIKMVCINFP